MRLFGGIGTHLCFTAIQNMGHRMGYCMTGMMNLHRVDFYDSQESRSVLNDISLHIFV